MKLTFYQKNGAGIYILRRSRFHALAAKNSIDSN